MYKCESSWLCSVGTLIVAIVSGCSCWGLLLVRYSRNHHRTFIGPKGDMVELASIQSIAVAGGKGLPRELRMPEAGGIACSHP